jgi:hypothetical protein
MRADIIVETDPQFTPVAAVAGRIGKIGQKLAVRVVV